MTSTAWKPTRTRLATLLLLGVLPASPAWAVQAPAGTSYDIDRIAAATPLETRDAATIEAALQRSPGWLDWSRAHPGWRVRWNLRTRTPHRMVGPGARVAAPMSAANVETACRSFLSSVEPLTGARTGSLRLARAEQRLGRWYVVFEQVENGVPVRGGRVDLRIGAGGEVVLLGSDFHRDVRVPAAPALGPEAALVAAARDLPDGAREPHHELVVVPEPQGDGFAYRLAWELRFRTTEPRGEWLALVDATTGALLRRENEIRYEQLAGRITAQIEPATIGDPYEERPLRDTRFDAVADTTEYGFTDPDGNFDVTTASIDSLDVRTRLAGRFAQVFNFQLGLTTPHIDTRMLPGSPRNFVWDDSNSRASERDAYYFALYSHQAILDLDPAFTGIDYTMPVVVDINNQDCNAFYDGFAINFFGESQRCVNFGRIADVVMHEYGHAITDHQYRPFAPNGAMHEAFSDYYAATLTDQPLIGRGYRGPGTFIRTLDNTRRWPDDVVGEPHRDGLILGGALWDLREAVGRGAADSLFHYARYGRAENFDDYMLDVLVTDDDNSNVYDGTPHFAAIVDSFRRHGIGDYSVQIDHQPLRDTEDLSKTLRLDATILSIFRLEPGSAVAHWSVNGGAFDTLPLVLVGPGPRDFSATIPPQPAGTTIAYYISASDTTGQAAVVPPQGEAAPFRFRVGTDTTPPAIVHAPLPDRPLDAPPGWPFEAQITDNLDHAVASAVVEWSRNSPALDQTLVLNPVTLPLWRAFLPTGGANLGDVFHYRIVATDSASSPNIGLSPVSGDNTFRVVQGSSRDFEPDDGGLVGDGDWDWGVPIAGPAAYSGTKVWGTGVNGTYSNSQESFLDLGAHDLSTWDYASLVFRSWFDSELGYDGGQVQASTDGTTWKLLIPNGGYPIQRVVALTGPGYSGDSQGWQQPEFDLSSFVGQHVALRLRFATDAGVVLRGWFVDDLELVERQVLSIPLRLQAQSGLDAEVALGWRSPAGINPEQVGSPLLGYHVHRATSPDLSDAIRATPAPVADTTFVDTGLTNGTVYYYYVTAVYAAGESAPSTVATAQPFVAEFASDAQAVYVPVPLGGASDTTITFSNPGTGTLKMNVFVGDATDDIDSVRVAFAIGSAGKTRGATGREGRPAARTAGMGGAGSPTLGPRQRDERARFVPSSAPPAAAILAAALGAPPAGSPTTEHTRGASQTKRPILLDLKPGTPELIPNAGSDAPSHLAAWQVLFTDTREGTTPDLKNLLVSESAGLIGFQVTGWQNWGNPFTDFNLLLTFDNDADRSTGDPSGDNIYVLVGPFAIAQAGVPAVIVSSGQVPLGIPNLVWAPTGADSMGVLLPSRILGATGQRIYVSVAALPPNLQGFVDGMPDPSATFAWMRPQAVHVSVTAGTTTPLVLAFPGTVPPGRYEGKLFLETNAPATPVATIPVTYDFLVTDVEVQAVEAEEEAGDVLLRWRTGREDDVAAFRVYRSQQGGTFEPLAPDIVPDPQHAYVYRDRDPGPGTFTYRIGEVASGGRVTLHGSATITVLQAPRAAFLDPAVPNPFNPTATLRFGIAVQGPADLVVYDARGRVVRTLWRETAAAPGARRVTWDGRDDSGVRVASGVYHVRLRTAGTGFARRLTLLK